jgi:hypothetical protein
MIRLYFHPSPNPLKVALFLEEASLAYEVVPVDTAKGEQHAPEFRAINPNGKTPAIVDTEGPAGTEARIFDSNAILLYLGDKTQRFIGTSVDRPELLSWLFFIATGLGPFSGRRCISSMPPRKRSLTRSTAIGVRPNVTTRSSTRIWLDATRSSDATIRSSTCPPGVGWIAPGASFPAKLLHSPRSPTSSAGSRRSTRDPPWRARGPSARGSPSREKWTKKPAGRFFLPTIRRRQSRRPTYQPGAPLAASVSAATR